ncbi:integrase core domain-containing protein [Parapedobacter sp. GCM10030251]|uniref:integrase core domain-containing protein n=1 Tax=Parapedobacter sp. GCM10030251 TaxID=3273419 RepID=UPI0036201D5E
MDRINIQLERFGIAISMTQGGSPYDNALAERVNGILKNEFYPKKGLSEPQRCIKKASVRLFGSTTSSAPNPVLISSHRKRHTSIPATSERDGKNTRKITVLVKVNPNIVDKKKTEYLVKEFQDYPKMPVKFF